MYIYIVLYSIRHIHTYTYVMYIHTPSVSFYERVVNYILFEKKKHSNKERQ